MYEQQRLPGAAIPLPAASVRSVDVDPVGMWYAFVGTLTRRRLLFAGVFFGIVFAVAIVTLLTPKRYTVDAKLIAGNPAAVMQNPALAQTGLPVVNALMLPSIAQSAETYAELFREAPVVQKVIDDLHLQTDVQALASSIKVKPVTNTNIITLSVTWSDPASAARIANDFATVFMAREMELISGQASGQLDYLRRELPNAARRLRDASNAVTRYETTHDIADLPAQTTTTVNEIAALDAKIKAVELEKRQADA
ncbi:MAG: hypothetical protein JOZ24_11100, partial [Candidatus Eremiobacteraeota bacterium]|nr:hypothetical protein [Candidatus Eremiobacteraeota bacterium]